MQIQKMFMLLYACLFALLAGLLATLGGLFQTEAGIAQAEVRRQQSQLLADELRQSSDDLTQMARLYAVTGEQRFRSYFEEILAIRNGKAPRPERYDLVYWDLVGPNGERPRPPGKPLALEERMRNAGFTAGEFAKLREAQRNSDALVRIEAVAMNAVEGNFDDGTGRFLRKGPPDLELARDLMFGNEYLASKAKIMVPLNDFFTMIDQRTAGEIAKKKNRGRSLAMAGILLSLLAISVAILTLAMLRRRVIQPLALAGSSAKSVAGGDFSQPISYRAKDEMGEFISTFNSMMRQVREMMEQLTTENLRMGAELDVTRRLQQMILPTSAELERIDDVDFACYMNPADEVGGDYYDIQQHDGRVKIGIGDVTGHGLESSVLMLMTQSIVRALQLTGETNPRRFFSTLNKALYGNVQRLGSDKNLSLALLDYADGAVMLSGQHEEILVARRNGTVERIQTINLGFPVGLIDEIDHLVDQTTLELQPGDGLIMYTDGITEAENPAGEHYGIERLCAVIASHWHESAAVIRDETIKDVYRHIGTQRVFDDVTLVVMKRK